MLSSTDNIFKWVSSDIVTLFLASTSAQINKRDNAGTMAGFLWINLYVKGVFSRIVIIISSENLKTGWIFNAPTIFFSRRQCLKTRSNFKHVLFYIVILCLNRNSRIGRIKFSDILGTFEIILIICIIWGFFYGFN